MYDSPYGHRVEIKFKGIADLDVIHDELDDGAELMFRSQVGLTEEKLHQPIRPKEALEVFQLPKRAKGPGYASKEVLEQVQRRFEINRPINQ